MPRSFFYKYTRQAGVVRAQAKLSLQTRAYSTSSKGDRTEGYRHFDNADQDKRAILDYVKGKAGIYSRSA